MPEGPDTSYVDVKPAGAGEEPPLSTGAEPRDTSEKPRRGDKPPKPRRAHRRTQPESKPLTGAPMKARSKVLEAKLGELLTFPAVPAAMVAGDPFTQGYMIEHFTRSAPRTAAALVEASESNPQLRAVLERITAGGSLLTVVIALVAYAAPPVMWTLGMREQAARFTQASTMTEADMEGILAQANAAAQAQHDAAQAAAAAAANGPAQPAQAEAEPGSFGGESSA